MKYCIIVGSSLQSENESEEINMQELQTATMQTPIEIALGIDENGMTTAKRLYEFLGLNPSNYAKWYRANISDNEFATENEDYWVSVLKEENPLGGRPTQDFKLTSRFAKKLSMLQKNERGEEAREYFTRVEDGMKTIAGKLKTLSPELQAIFLHDEKIQQVNNKLQAVDEDLQKFKRNLPLLPAEAELITYIVNKCAVRALGGKESNAYKDKSLRGKVYGDIHRELKRQFGVTKYKYIKGCNCNLAVSIIENHELPIVLQEQIADCNAQMNMEVA